MPNTITSAGLTTATYAELLAYFTSAYQSIYGADIDLSSNTPDGQMMNIYIQSVLDLQDFVSQVYSGFDPNQAFGNTLDLRVAINGIQRQAATYTVTNVTVVTSQSVNLYGLDQTAQSVFTVADGAGNQYQLQQTQLGIGPASSVLSFIAVTPGAVITVPNTITVPVTIVLGVTSVNNPTVYTTLGVNEETDAQLKYRRQKSVSLSSQGYYNGLFAALENIPGVTFAYIDENDTGSTNVDGVPGHSIWVIVAGTGANSAIAQAIYTKRNAGCGMYNSGDSNAMSYPIIQADGSTFIVYWDTVISVPLFQTFTVASLNKTVPPNIAAITAGLVNDFVPGPAAQVNTNEISSFVQTIDPNSFVSGAGFSAGNVQTISFSAVAASGAFELSYGAQHTTSLAWNISAANIQVALRLLTGLGAVTVTGTTATSIVVTMTGVTNPTLLGVYANSLLTAGSAAITFNFLGSYTNTLTPNAKNKQFVVTAGNTIVLTMILAAPSGILGIAYNIDSSTGVVTNTTLTIVHGNTFTFLGLGGYGTLTYSVSTGTGGSIVSTTGVYTAGTAGTDTVTVTDALGNSAFCTVTIT